MADQSLFNFKSLSYLDGNFHLLLRKIKTFKKTLKLQRTLKNKRQRNRCRFFVCFFFKFCRTIVCSNRILSDPGVLLSLYQCDFVQSSGRVLPTWKNPSPRRATTSSSGSCRCRTCTRWTWPGPCPPSWASTGASRSTTWPGSSATRGGAASSAFSGRRSGPLGRQPYCISLVASSNNARGYERPLPSGVE